MTERKVPARIYLGQDENQLWRAKGPLDYGNSLQDSIGIFIEPSRILGLREQIEGILAQKKGWDLRTIIQETLRELGIAWQTGGLADFRHHPSRAERDAEALERAYRKRQ